MFYESELHLLRNTFRKCRIQTTILDLDSTQDAFSEPALPAFILNKTPVSPLRQITATANHAIIYRLRDPFGCRYMYLRLPELPADAVLVIGPYLSTPPTQEQVMEWAERNAITPSQQKQMVSFYNAVPILPETSHLFSLLYTFAEHLWGVNGFSVEDMDQDPFVSPSLLASKKASSDEEDTLWQMKSMEQRYQYENEIMAAVTKGQHHKANILLNNLSTFFFEQRAADPVRNAQNYCIIMNTLLRKAAEQGGVHPVYLDRTSSAFALRIEQMLSIDDVTALMGEMFQTYCRLVRKHSMRDYSPPVQQALICIDGNLASNLNLRTLAEMLNISGSYLSTIFKKETGQTVTDYIANRRVSHAKELLSSTRLQVQTIAQHCGIMDVHYFSKIFKKITGQTPKEYREALKK